MGSSEPLTVKFGEAALNAAGANEESKSLKFGLVMSVACAKEDATRSPERLSQMVAMDFRMHQIIPRFPFGGSVSLKKRDADDKDADDSKEKRMPVQGMDQPKLQVRLDLRFFDMRKANTGL